MSVHLRQRYKGKKISLYLDYYHHKKRKYEYLRLYLFPKPEKGTLSREQKQENKKTLALAESIRAKRHLQNQSKRFGLPDQEKLKASFITYFDLLKQKRKDKSSYGTWQTTGNYLKKYCPQHIAFDHLSPAFVQGFKDYLKTQAQSRLGKPLVQSSRINYFATLKTALKQAIREGIIKHDPSQGVSGFKREETIRSFLTLEEVQTLATTPCNNGQLKTAFIFSCLTGLRWSDIHKLTWEEVQHSKAMGCYIRFRQKKTKGTQTLPISDQARKMLGQAKDAQERVLKDLKTNSQENKKLKQWIKSAGLSKNITFHVARHTYATLQLTLGTDIYTVSKMLGHADLKTTQIYANIIDSKKKEAAHRIQLTL